MKDVWDACRFSDDIVLMDFSKAKFAVELHEFLDGTADNTYQDPKTFFDNTFLTDQMKLLIEDVLGRLSFGRGQPVTVIDTGFGGGKTHSLLLLHHILSSRDSGLDFIRKHALHINSIPQVKIVEIDCREITKNTLWGEIAYRLDRYDEFEHMDTSKEPPTDISAIKRLFEGPVLVMLDELPHYLAKVSAMRVGKKFLSELTILYIMELISAVVASPRASLILTLTEKQSLYKDYTAEIHSKVNKRLTDFKIDETIDTLSEAISRQTHTMTPVNRNQIYNVVNARLVKNIDEAERDITIQQYTEYYDRYGIDAGDILEKMRKSYPFHPNLIDILHDRVSTIGKFNQTRGMLRLLALIVRHVVERKPSCKMIGASDVKLDNPNIKNELTVRLGLDLGAVMDTDCVSHAKNADSTKSVKIVESIAASVMLFSLHGHTKKSGQRRGDIKVAVGYPGLDPSLIDKALEEDIMQNFWYIHDIGGQEFYFTESPNINAIIHEHKKSVTITEIKCEIRHSLKKLLPSAGFKIILWESDGLTDDDSLKLFVAPYDVDLMSDAGKEQLRVILHRSGDSIRTNKNTITTVCAEPTHIRLLEDDARILAAVKKARKDERVKADKEFVREMATREEDFRGQLSRTCLMAYSHVLYPRGPEIQDSEIVFGESKKTNITEAVIDVLKKRGKMVDIIAAAGLEIGDEPIKITQLYDSFAQDTYKTLIRNKDSIGEAIIEGIFSKMFGYFTKIEKEDGKYLVKEARGFEWDGFLVDKSVCIWPPPPPPGAGHEPSTNSSVDSPPQPFHYTLRMKDFDKTQHLIAIIPILNLEEEWRSAKKQFQANMSMGETRLDISSDLSDNKYLKDLLSITSGRIPSVDATLSVASNHTLDGIFKEHDLEEYIQ